MAVKLTIADLNSMDAGQFAAALGHIFEHAPWIAARAAGKRPFMDRADLHRAMMSVVDAASADQQMALIRGHPELAGKAAIAGALTADSKKEQGGAGLDRLTPEEFARFHDLNAAYRAKFGFPFILAVKGKDKHEILAAFAARLDNAHDRELATALRQVGRIAAFRLADIVDA